MADKELSETVPDEVSEADMAEILEEDEYGVSETSGRLSPWAREQIWHDFHEGVSVRDLALKFGILPYLQF